MLLSVCAECCVKVFEYCAIHGPLLVIPDEKIPNTPEIPTPIPRAALTIPSTFLHINRSSIPGAGLGVFSSLSLPRGVRFGPYVGKKTQVASSAYCWQINENSHQSIYVDAEDAECSNWMRYVNCSRHWLEQNLIAYQYRGSIYYRSIKVVPPFTELLVFYGEEAAQSLGVDLKKYILATPSLLGKPTDKQNLKEIENDRKNGIGERTNVESEEEKDIESDRKNGINERQNELSERNEVFKCDHCDYKTDNKNNIITHMQIHTIQKQNLATNHFRNQTKKLFCEICPYLSTDRNDFFNHMTIHGYNFYSCTFCKYVTNNNRYLKKHMLSHNTEKIFSCTLCTYKCTQHSYLLKHVKIHSTDKCLRCEFCSYKTAVKSNLTKHVRRHSTQRFSCDLCTFMCTQKDNLLRHVKTHFSDKIFSCEHCSYKATNKRNLVRHSETHVTEKRFSCEICKNLFKCKRYLMKHMKTHDTSSFSM